MSTKNSPAAHRAICIRQASFSFVSMPIEEVRRLFICAVSHDGSVYYIPLNGNEEKVTYEGFVSCIQRGEKV